MVTVQIVLYDGFDELDAIGPYEIFDNADIDVQLVTLDPVDVIEASHGLRVEPQGTLSNPNDPDSADDADYPDVLIVPGGGWNDRAEAGARGEVERGDLPDAVAHLHENGTTIASVCTGGMILAHAGVLDGKPATTHAGALDDLQERVGEVREERVVDCGSILTAGGVTSGLDLSLHLVERITNEETAERIAQNIEYERRSAYQS